MRLRHLPVALAAMSLVASPALAAPTNAAAALSTAKSVRAAAPAGKTSKMVSGSATYALIGFLAVVAAVVVITQVADDDSDSN